MRRAVRLLTGGATAALVLTSTGAIATPSLESEEASAPGPRIFGLESPDALTRFSAAESAPLRQQQLDEYNTPYDALYHFVRIQWSTPRGFTRRRGGGMWAHDWPRADRNFMKIIDETTYIRVPEGGTNVLSLADPEFFRFPITYIVEPGFWNPSDEEVANLGEYLLKGGFLIVDDFRGRRDLDNLEFQLSRALPDHRMVQIDETSEIFDSFFRIVPEQVIPPYGGQIPLWYALYEDNDPSKRLMVIINANNDIAEYWEFSDYGYYPIDLANEAYKLGVNYVVYALTH